MHDDDLGPWEDVMMPNIGLTIGQVMDVFEGKPSGKLMPDMSIVPLSDEEWAEECRQAELEDDDPADD